MTTAGGRHGSVRPFSRVRAPFSGSVSVENEDHGPGRPRTVVLQPPASRIRVVTAPLGFPWGRGPGVALTP